ncbi:hypothetical protein MM1218R_03663 [Mycobacterium marinum]|uniref:hypothetical protein n=1 Tax=Mycobacterium marinum TaxID=1781 RepID=UPI000E28AD1B|nr:hypothetical protein [Mycobacterium marinum]AXN45597.1 hypothetical protein MM1218R_03663 [Mycobacterium marinum]RFZ01769.1 hypothetical protein DE4381_05216 [Mycobacterium marinum]
MAAPTVTDVVNLLGTTPPDAQVTQALSVITNIAHAYTRGVGFTEGEPNDEIAAVILTATARLLRNPSGLPVREQMGQIVVDYRGGFTGWSIGERDTLNRYRVSAL